MIADCNFMANLLHYQNHTKGNGLFHQERRCTTNQSQNTLDTGKHGILISHLCRVLVAIFNFQCGLNYLKRGQTSKKIPNDSFLDLSNRFTKSPASLTGNKFLLFPLSATRSVRSLEVLTPTESTPTFYPLRPDVSAKIAKERRTRGVPGPVIDCKLPTVTLRQGEETQKTV